MSAEENKALVLRLIDAFNRQDLDVLDEIIGEDYTDHLPLPDQVPGPVGAKHANAHFYQAFPDVHQATEDIVAEGDRVVVRWTCRGTHMGVFNPIPGVPPTGKKVEVSGIEIYRIANGKIVENWHVLDALGFLLQLEVLPPIGAPAPVDSDAA